MCLTGSKPAGTACTNIHVRSDPYLHVVGVSKNQHITLGVACCYRPGRPGDITSGVIQVEIDAITLYGVSCASPWHLDSASICTRDSASHDCSNGRHAVGKTGTRSTPHAPLRFRCLSNARHLTERVELIRHHTNPPFTSLYKPGRDRLAATPDNDSLTRLQRYLRP